MPNSSFISPTSHRWIVCALCSLAGFILRFETLWFKSLVKTANSVLKIDTIPSGGCPFLFSGTVWEKGKVKVKLPSFYWDVHNTELAYSILITTVVIMTPLAALLSDVGYSRYTLGGGMFLMAGSNLALCLFYTMGDALYLAINIINGLTWALIVPSCYTLISQWSLPSHRNIYTTIVYLGDICALNMTRYLLNFSYTHLKSWRSGHIVACIGSMMWLGIGFIFIHHSPNESPFLRQDNTNIRSFAIVMKRLQATPWRKIATSLPFLSLLLASISANSVCWMNIFSLEDYQKYVLHLPKRFSDNFTPMEMYVVPLALMGGLLADWIIRHDLMSNTSVKKTFLCISLSLTSLLQFALPFVGCNIIPLWIISISSVFFLGLAIPVISSSPMDLSLRNSGLLTGIIFSIQVLIYVFRHEISRKLKSGNQIWDDWQHIFIFYSTLSLAMMIPFIFFGSGEAQGWHHSRRPLVHATAHPREH